MASIFTKIVNGEIPCYKIAETKDFLAFFDINPLAKGHTLVITKQEIDYIFDVEDNLYKELMLFAKRVGLAIEKVVPCKRMGLTVIGIEVPHTHVHLIPINNVGDMNFANPKVKLSDEEFAQLAKKISAEFK